MQSLQEEICQLIREQEQAQNISDEELMGKNLIDDMEFDSIQLVDLIFSLEEKYGIQITDMTEWLESLQSVRDLIAYVGEKISARKQESERSK